MTSWPASATAGAIARRLARRAREWARYVPGRARARRTAAGRALPRAALRARSWPTRRPRRAGSSTSSARPGIPRSSTSTRPSTRRPSATAGSPPAGARPAARRPTIYRSRVGAGGAALDPFLRALLRRGATATCCASSATSAKPTGRDDAGSRACGSATSTSAASAAACGATGGSSREAARRDRDLAVIESDAGERDAPLGALRAAARRLRGADVVHLQWKLADWGPRTRRPATDSRSCDCRCGAPIVVTLHDVFERQGAARALARARPRSACAGWA